MMIRRGDIYYIEGGMKTSGSEQHGRRPGIIVSNNRENRSSSTVMVVYLTTKPKKDLPTHCTITATGKESTALCEQVFTVDVYRLGRYMGKCSGREQTAIDNCLLIAQDLDSDRAAEQLKEENRQLREAVEAQQTEIRRLIRQLEMSGRLVQEERSKRAVEKRRRINAQLRAQNLEDRRARQ